MIYMISKEQAKAAVEHINGSKYSLATATEVELETLRENNERVSKDVLQHDHQGHLPSGRRCVRKQKRLGRYL